MALLYPQLIKHPNIHPCLAKVRDDEEHGRAAHGDRHLGVDFGGSKAEKQWAMGGWDAWDVVVLSLRF